MFFQSTDEKQSENSVTSDKSSRKKRSKKSAKSKLNNKDSLFKKNHRFAASMTSWAESFTVAATWQLKHQLAYWKSKAKSLEYENKILHDIIRKNCIGSTSGSSNSETETKCPINVVNFQQQEDSEASDSEHDSASEPEKMEEDDNEFEVSEEFVAFLRANAKYKEEARLEREKLKAKMEGKDIIEELEAGPSEPVDTTTELKQCYGSDYKRIGALEIALQSKYLEECDKSNPMYWPNIPFNFS